MEKTPFNCSLTFIHQVTGVLYYTFCRVKNKNKLCETKVKRGLFTLTLFDNRKQILPMSS